ncbi:MAG: Por secretion system C-terminal sorting protein, partial [Candidatus Krumholzibacteriota bacterium]|nr:Por secretion system C-terminal sorting protein [Candidatus Krumholzibacteriota bacterium]
KLPGESAGSIAVGDVDGDGDLELVAQSKGTYGKVYLFHHTGAVAVGWPKTVALKDIYFTSSPGLADFNNDGNLEIFAYGWDSSVSRIHVFTHTGAYYAGWPLAVSGYYSEASLVAGDLNGDGTPEIVFGDESRLVHAYNIAGQEIDGFPVTTQESVRAAPFICDFDSDGGTELLVYGWDRNVYAWNLDGTYSQGSVPWPTFQGNVHRNGLFGFELPTAIADPSTEGAPPAAAALLQNYPNPFNPTTRIEFDVPRGRPQPVTLRVYDITGARVRTLVDEILPMGRHAREWDGRDDRGNLVGSGVYFYQLRTAGLVATRKTVLLK